MGGAGEQVLAAAEGREVVARQGPDRGRELADALVDPRRRVPEQRVVVALDGDLQPVREFAQLAVARRAWRQQPVETSRIAG